MTGPLAPEVLVRLERYLLRIERPASAAQLAERLLMTAADLRAEITPPPELFELCAAIALAGAAEARRAAEIRGAAQAGAALDYHAIRR